MEHIVSIAKPPQNPLQSAFSKLFRKGKNMQEKDDNPSIGIIYETWLTTAQAAEIIGISQQAINAAIHRYTGDDNDPLALKAIKLPTPGRGIWRIDPESVERYKRRYEDTN